jgi:methylase of polypeptide subunit release factors
MKETTVFSELTVPEYSPNQVFFCPEESQFYAQCIEKMVLNQCSTADSVVEFGAGEGSPVIHALLRTPFQGFIQGYELNSVACKQAQSRITQHGLIHQYAVHNKCFFQHADDSANYLIANPPYLPAPDDDLYMPTLFGGTDGAQITNQLLELHYDSVLLMISSYSNPMEVVERSLGLGYQIIDFMTTPLEFGYYSCEPKVGQTIAQLRQKHKAFYSENIYLLAGVLFSKARSNRDISTEFLKVMTAL